LPPAGIPLQTILDQFGEYSWAEWTIGKRQGRPKARLEATLWGG